MTEVVEMSTDAIVGWASADARRRLRRRYAAELRLKLYGLVAIGLALGLLAVLIGSLLLTGASAFRQSMVDLPVFIDPEKVKADAPLDGNYRAMIRDALFKLVPGITAPREQREALKVVSDGADHILRQRVGADTGLIGRTLAMRLPLSDPLDQLHKGFVAREAPEDQRRVGDIQIKVYDALAAQGLVALPFNWALFVNPDSRFPEVAGLLGAIVGSFYTVLMCLLISFPVGIAAAVYLEEFAPKNRLTDLIEVNINNLAAVPSVVFGLLGLAVFLGFFGLPRSAPLVGGMTLALIVLPTIIIATRASLQAVPPSIREAALGVGASKHQMIMHHVLPLAMPGILTGTIIGLAHALGETAPLLLIGMNASITSVTASITDPATVLPTQILIWAESPERGFIARTSAAILVLLAFLVLMNGLAIYLRQRFERRW